MIKFVFIFEGGQEVEFVWILEIDCVMFCVLLQVGCVLECIFCLMVQQGFNCNLSVSEIIGQVWCVVIFFGFLKDLSKCFIINVVMMGMGELLFNFKNVVLVMDIMLDDFGFGLFKCCVMLSIFGVVFVLDMLGD